MQYSNITLSMSNDCVKKLFVYGFCESQSLSLFDYFCQLYFLAAPKTKNNKSSLFEIVSILSPPWPCTYVEVLCQTRTNNNMTNICCMKSKTQFF